MNNSAYTIHNLSILESFRNAMEEAGYKSLGQIRKDLVLSSASNNDLLNLATGQTPAFHLPSGEPKALLSEVATLLNKKPEEIVGLNSQDVALLLEQESAVFDEDMPFLREIVETALQSLSSRRRNILRESFWSGKPLEEIARDMREIGGEERVTTERVRQIELMALRELKCSEIADDLHDFYEQGEQKPSTEPW